MHGTVETRMALHCSQFTRWATEYDDLIVRNRDAIIIDGIGRSRPSSVEGTEGGLEGRQASLTKLRVPRWRNKTKPPECHDGPHSPVLVACTDSAELEFEVVVSRLAVPHGLILCAVQAHARRVRETLHRRRRWRGRCRPQGCQPRICRHDAWSRAVTGTGRGRACQRADRTRLERSYARVQARRDKDACREGVRLAVQAVSRGAGRVGREMERVWSVIRR